jgi:hypothetical protein
MHGRQKMKLHELRDKLDELASQGFDFADTDVVSVEAFESEDSNRWNDEIIITLRN